MLMLKMKKAKKIIAAIITGVLIVSASCSAFAYTGNGSDYSKYKDYYSVSSAPIDEETLKYLESIYPEVDELLDYYADYSLYELTREQAIMAMLNRFLSDYPHLAPYMANSLLTAFDMFGGYYANISIDALFGGNSYYGYGVIIDGKEIINANKYNAVIYHVIKDSPADKAGIMAGDEFVKIDDINVEGFGMKLVSDLLAVVEDEASLVLRRDGKEFSVTVTKDMVTYETISYEIIDEAKKTALITISDFIGDNLIEDLYNILNELHTNGYKNLIIDLRDNGGGNLEYLYESLNFFVKDEGVVLGTIESRESKTEDVTSSGDGFEFDKFCILTNRDTASAAEAFALALSELTGGVIMGETTYGKGIGQSYIELNNGDIAGITTLELISPDGVKYHSKGIEPHISVKQKFERAETVTFDQLNFVNCIDIKKDADNKAVLALNQRLSRIGYISPDKVSSKCTEETITAVEIFQKYYDLPMGIDKIDYIFLEYLNYYTNYAPMSAISGDAPFDCAKVYMFEGEQAAKDFVDSLDNAGNSKSEESAEE